MRWFIARAATAAAVVGSLALGGVPAVCHAGRPGSGSDDASVVAGDSGNAPNRSRAVNVPRLPAAFRDATDLRDLPVLEPPPTVTTIPHTGAVDTAAVPWVVRLDIAKNSSYSKSTWCTG